ncbi:MAG: polysaccharide biosynthesis tyrosine autokinase [Lewinellaceae bacterium]|nr:polysaccharide biosynthesis tyrosine autokinase [Lewinellaceae bacterium]
MHTPLPEHPFDWRAFLFRLLRNWYWFALAFAVSIALAWVYLRYAVPIYQVSGTVLIQNEKNQRALTEAFITEKLGLGANFEIEDEIQLLKSRSLMRRVVDSLRIHLQYFSEGRVKTSEVYPYLDQVLAMELRYAEPEKLAYGVTLRIEPLPNEPGGFVLVKAPGDTLHGRFGQSFSVGRVEYLLALNDSLFHKTGQPHIIRISNPEAVAQGYAGKLAVQQIGRSNVLAISLVDPIPDKAINILNTLADLYGQSIVEDKNKVGKQTLRFIDERLRFVTEELYGVEREVEQFKRGRNLPVALSVQAQAFLTEITDKDQALAELDMRQNLLQSIERFFAADSNYLKPLPVASEIISGELATVVKNYNELAVRRRNLLQSATPDNPAARAGIRQLDELRQSILLSVHTLSRETADRRRQLRELLVPLETQMGLMPRNERELIQIMRQQQIKENLFLFLLQKREETALSVAAQVGNSRVIDRAANAGLIAPKRFQTFLFAGLAGLILPALFFYLLALFRNTLDSEADLKQLTTIPFLGSIALRGKKDPVVVRAGSRSAISEMFRLLRTNLQFVLGDEKSPVVLVTSGISGEGKTFISANLGMTMALSGKRTVVIGLDLRKPKLGQYLGEANPAHGITHYLIGQADADAIIVQSTHSEHLYYIPTGPLPPNPAELILNGKLETLFHELRLRFDFIVVDTAPVGLVADAMLLTPFVSATLCVARAGKTDKNLVRFVDQLNREGKLRHPAFVLNGVKKGKGYGYGGYGYGYGYYQE